MRTVHDEVEAQAFQQNLFRKQYARLTLLHVLGHVQRHRLGGV